jgi:hypothetical protein
MRRIDARRKNASAFRLRFSQSLASRRQPGITDDSFDSITSCRRTLIDRAIAEAAKAFGVPAASIKKDNIRIALKAGRI